MQAKIPRENLVEEVILRLHESPAVAILGARQVGKTTLSRMISNKWKGTVNWFDLESAKGRASLESTPEIVLKKATGLVIIDEIQRMPHLFELLRPICDNPERKAVFLLLGSASWELVKGVSESLAGRVQFVQISGFSLDEINLEHQDRLWLRGGFPPAFLAPTDDAWDRWLEGFRQTFLERDIPGLGLRVAPSALNRFWNMLAHFHGQVWNSSTLARSMDVSVTAVNHYRDLLEGTFMARVLPPWHENMGKRQLKSPKVYLRDSGILHHLLGITKMLALRSHPVYGASWEGFALEQTLITHGKRDAYFWGTQAGAELDLMLLRQSKRWGFEFKCSDAPSTSKSMHISIQDLQLEHLWIVYPGTESYDLSEKITAIPLSEVRSITFLNEK